MCHPAKDKQVWQKEETLIKPGPGHADCSSTCSIAGQSQHSQVLAVDNVYLLTVAQPVQIPANCNTVKCFCKSMRLLSVTKPAEMPNSDIVKQCMQQPGSPVEVALTAQLLHKFSALLLVDWIFWVQQLRFLCFLGCPTMQLLESCGTQNYEQNLEQSVEQNVEQNMEQNLEQNVELSLEQNLEQNLQQNLEQMTA